MAVSPSTLLVCVHCTDLHMLLWPNCTNGSKCISTAFFSFCMQGDFITHHKRLNELILCFCNANMIIIGCKTNCRNVHIEARNKHQLCILSYLGWQMLHRIEILLLGYNERYLRSCAYELHNSINACRIS